MSEGSAAPLRQNLWERFGFAGDPFDTAPLPTQPGGGLSVGTAYVQREGLLDPGTVLRNFLKNPGGGRIVVEGEPGVGKTTFVNFHRHEWESHGQPPLLSPISHISVERDWDERAFILSLLSALSARLRLKLGERKFDRDDLLQQMAAITGVRMERDGGFSLSASFAGTGGSVSRSTRSKVQVGSLTIVELRDYLRRLVEKIRTDFGYGGVIFHLDNLELLRAPNETNLQRFFEDIRDTIQELDVYFIFVGYAGMFQEAIAPAPRVRSIFFDNPLKIEPLSLEQVHRIIQLRYELLSVREDRWIEPVEPAVIDYFYETFEGKIRFVMNAVTTLVSYLPDSFADTLSKADATQMLCTIQQGEIAAHLSRAEVEVFLEAVQLRRFTPTDLSQRTGKSKQLIQKHLTKLLDRRYVHYAERSGRSQFYEVEPRFHVLCDAG